MKPNTIAIVGCGRLGSTLAYTLALKSRDPDFSFNKIELIDPDLLSDSDFPYSVLMPDDFEAHVNYPKVFALEYVLSSFISDQTELVPKYEKFPKDICDTTYYIDCRDNSACTKLCKIKASCEGPYGRIILNPEDCEGSPVNYTLFPSPFYTLHMSILICDHIFNKPIEDTHMKEIPFNLLKGVSY